MFTSLLYCTYITPKDGLCKITFIIEHSCGFYSAKAIGKEHIRVTDAVTTFDLLIGVRDAAIEAIPGCKKFDLVSWQFDNGYFQHKKNN